MASASLQRGDRLAASGQLDAALQHYERAVSLQPSAAPARQRLCHALVQRRPKLTRTPWSLRAART